MQSPQLSIDEQRLYHEALIFFGVLLILLWGMACSLWDTLCTWVVELRRQRTSRELLEEYNDLLESMPKSVDLRADAELVKEIELIEELHRKGQPYDDILRRRINRSRAQARKAHRHP